MNRKNELSILQLSKPVAKSGRLMLVYKKGLPAHDTRTVLYHRGACFMPGTMNTQTSDRLRIPLIAALATFGLHLVGNPHYGYFRDELYFIICGQHPQWGYVDQPPVAPLLAAGSQMFGHSLVLLRAIPAFFAAAAVYVSCLLAAELGGGAFAEILAALVVFFAPVLMNFGMKVSPTWSDFGSGRWRRFIPCV